MTDVPVLDLAATESSPGLRAEFGVGPDTTAQLLVTGGGNPDCLRTAASFVALCGAAPVPDSQRQDQLPPPPPRR
ncbi:hypothetical protein [Streptomyces sp. ML-6]|uniref:hypothetical protein n=1 Tax=Streptomyces sp. ML-6 TaxID=2982693 RepID=UPI0024C0500F|nr:hypothetical protein [Streptomyces sp. ML-6]MDK0524501.1 IS110 family transposase [Streptomyces sp. ML-6]